MAGSRDSRPGVHLAPLLLLFLLSGASALVYQVLWMRLLALVFGVTVHAASTVLAAFMTGLAIGSAAAGRMSDRVKRPLRAFAIAEALVAVAALSTPLGLSAVEATYVRLHAMADRFGDTTVPLAFEALLARGERRMREAIARLPAGVYAYQTYLDNSGESAEPLLLRLKLTISGTRSTPTSRAAPRKCRDRRISVPRQRPRRRSR